MKRIVDSINTVLKTQMLVFRRLTTIQSQITVQIVLLPAMNEEALVKRMILQIS